MENDKCNTLHEAIQRTVMHALISFALDIHKHTTLYSAFDIVLP